MDMTETLFDLDPIKRAIEGLHLQEEALMRRMLCAWDPTWGEPVLVHKVLSAGDMHVPRWDDPDQTYRVQSSIGGLAQQNEVGDVCRILVPASDHIDEHGRVKAPMPDKGMLAILQKRLDSIAPPVSQRTV